MTENGIQRESKDVAENDSSIMDDKVADETTPLFGEQHKEHLLKPGPGSNKLRKRLTFAAFALMYFTMTASYSVIAPFFPTEAKAKGANGNVIGIIFGVFSLVTFIFSPITGVLLPTLGIRFLLFTGIFIAGVAEFLFGFLNNMPEGDVFIAYSLVLRAVDGLGGAAAMTAAVACLAQCFPENVGAVMGGLELFTGIGLTLGPLIGGLLYQYGGFGLPFFVLSGLMLLSLPIIWWILPSSMEQASSPNTEERRDVTMLSFFKIPAFTVTVSAIVLGGMALGIVEPTLAIHLKSEYGVSNASTVGVIFFVLSGSYALLAPLSGWLGDKTDRRATMTLGCFLLSISFFLLGPVPFSFIPKSLTLVYISTLLVGSALGPYFTPCMSEMEHISRSSGFPDDLATHGLISGIFGAAFNIGAFIGPTCSGIIMEHLSFPWLCTGFGLLLLVQSLFLLAITISGRKARTREKPEVSGSNAT